LGGGSFKYLIPGIIAVILLSAVFLSNKFITKQAVGSIYNIDELKNNFSNVKIGDTINYEINGYSDWEVLYTDIDNGTIDIVSKTNTEDLTLEPNQTKEYYENIFQETANKYNDNKYVIGARTVNYGDYETFQNENDFWLNNINEETISISHGNWNYRPKNYKIYVIPYVKREINTLNIDSSVGSVIDYELNGINKWVIIKSESTWSTYRNLTMIPETPIELEIANKDDNINEKVNQIINSFDGNYVYQNGTSNLPNLIPNFLNQQSEKIWIIYGNNSCFSNSDNGISYSGCGSLYNYDNGTFGNAKYNDYIWRSNNPKTLGYRPVVTLKIDNEIKTKNTSEKLKIGDNVKYEAKGYKNWKVLSIDEDNNTVDIISGGIVKNLTLTGKEDWENYENILQREIDEYKNGDNAIEAKIIENYDIDLLKQIRDKVKSKYWLNYKKKENYGSTTNYNVYFAFYSSSLYTSSIILYTNSENQSMYYSAGDVSYTAGLRPIITLKLDSIERISEDETKKIEESTQKTEKIIIKEQESKNKDYNKYIDKNESDNSNLETKDNNTDKDTDNMISSNGNITNKYVTNNTRPRIIDYFLIVLVSINTVISVLTFIKLKRKH